MVGLKVRGKLAVAVAGSSLGLGGCVGRTFDFGFDTEGFDGSGDSDTGNQNPTGDPTDPTSNPTDPTDPTSNPTDPTTDPTDPTSIPDAPPQLLNVAFLDNLTLELTFSEPMASVDAIDPTLFRLSMAIGITDQYYEDGARTFYQDVGYFAADPYCEDIYCNEICDDYYYGTTGYGDSGRYCYEYCYDYCPTSPLLAFNLRNDLYDPTKVLLQLDRGITSETCEFSEQLPPDITAGLYLHYTDDRPPIPTDTQGQGLFPISEDWALTPDNFLEIEGLYPNLGDTQPIPCPF